MIRKGINFKNSEVEKGKYICRNTTSFKDVLQQFSKIGSINSNEKIKPLRICFDLDNTYSILSENSKRLFQCFTLWKITLISSVI